MPVPVSIYLVTNTVNGKRYVGQTRKEVANRWKQHCAACRRDAQRGCTAFWSAIRKYGPDSFQVETLVIVNEELANEYEAKLIEAYATRVPAGYNI